MYGNSCRRGTKIRLIDLGVSYQNFFWGYLRVTRHLPHVAWGTARPKQRSGGLDTERLTLSDCQPMMDSDEFG